MENNYQNIQPPNVPYYPYPAQPTPPSALPAGKRELIFGALIAVFSLLLCNCLLFGGFNLGFAVCCIAGVSTSVIYLGRGGCRLTPYSAVLLILSGVICLGFARSDDSVVKLLLTAFLLLAVNLALCLMAGQNRRSPAGFLSVADGFRCAFVLGLGESGPAFRGLGRTFRQGGPSVKKAGAVLIGLAVAVPVLCILIPLLMSADAAFSGVVGLLPDLELSELIVTVLVGAGLFCVLYPRGVALCHKPKAEAAEVRKSTVSALTVNTVLGAVGLVYGVYLLSQLAYFAGGFSGILPEGFTLAEYARRGFFEMAWLCAVNLGMIALAVGLVAKKEGKTPLATRLLCLFVGLVTVFLVVSASAKMALYIGDYGLTRLRVLTEVAMVFLGLTTVLVCLWLFLPKLPYMKAVLLLALSMGVLTLWADVDTVVAAYNVTAYESGVLEQVDVVYLSKLGDGVVPYLVRLTEDQDPKVAAQAKRAIARRESAAEDIRGWNFADWYAQQWTAE